MLKKQEGFDLAKAMSFLLAFVAMAMIIGVGFLVPTVRTIKKQSMLLEVEGRSYKAIKERYEEEDTKLTNLKKENINLLSALITTFNPDSFQNSQKAKLGAIVLQKKSSEIDGDYYMDDYSVAISFDTPKSMFDFMDSLDKSGSLVKISTPLSIASTTEHGITANFYLRAISAKLGKRDINATTKPDGAH